MTTRTERLNFVLSADTKGLTKGLAAAERGLSAMAKGAKEAVDKAKAAVDKAGAGMNGMAADARKSSGAVKDRLETTGTAMRDMAEKTRGAVRKLRKGLEEGGAAFGTFSKKAKVELTGVERALKQMESGVNRAAGKLKSTFLKVQGLLAGAVVGAGAASPIKFAADFELALAEVDSILFDAGVSVERYREQLLKLSQESSKDLIDLTRGLYQTISAGIPAVEGAGGAFDVLEKAQRAAVAGLTETETAVDAFTTVLNAYSGTGLTAAQVSDKLFKTVVVGKTEFKDLAGSIGRVATVSASFGISLDETLAAIASLTKAGLSTDEAVTQLRAAILGLAQPQDNVRKKLASLGIEIGEAAFRSKGLAGVLGEIGAATGQSSDLISELFPNVRALVGAMILGKDAGRGFAKDLDAVRNSAGSTDYAAGKIAATFTDLARIFKSQFQAVMIDAGTRVLPKVRKALEDLGTYMIANQGAISDGFERFMDLVFALGKFIVDNGGKILAFFGTIWAVNKIEAAASATSKFVGALTSASTGTAVAGAGEAAGKGFLAGFSKMAPGLSKFLGALAKAPGLIGVAVSLGITITSVLSDVIGDAISASAMKAMEAAKEELDRFTKRADAAAKKLGFRSNAEALESRQRLESGDAMTVGAFRAEAVQTPGEALAGLLGTGVALEDAATTLYDEAEAQAIKLEAKAARARREIDEVRRARGAELLMGGTAAQVAALEERAQGFIASAEKLRASADTAVAAAYEADEAARKNEEARLRASALPGGGGSGEAEKKRADALRELLAVQKDIAAGQRDLALQITEEALASISAGRQAANEAAEEDRASRSEAHAQRLEDLRAQGAAEEELAEERARFAEENADAEISNQRTIIAAIDAEKRASAELVDERQRAAIEAANDAIAAAEEEGIAIASVFARGTEDRVSAEKVAAARILLIREQLAADLSAIGAAAAADDSKRSDDALKAEKKIAKEISAKAAAAIRATTFNEKLATTKPKFLEQLAELQDGVVQTIEHWTRLGPLAGSVANLWSKGADAAATDWAEMLKNLALSITTFSGKMADALFDGITAAASSAFEIFDDSIIGPIIGAFDGAFGSLFGGLDAGISALTDLETDGKGGGAAISKAADAAFDIVSRLSSALPGLVERFLSVVATKLPKLLTSAAGGLARAAVAVGKGLGPVIQAAIEGLSAAVPVLIDGIVESLPLVFDALLRGVGTLLTKLPTIFDKMLAGLTDTLAGLLAKLADQIGPILVGEIDATMGMLTALLERIPELVSTLISGVIDAVGGVIDSIPSIIAALAESLPSLIPALLVLAPSLIVAILKGVVEGVFKVIGRIGDSLRDFFTGEFLDSAISALGDVLSEFFEPLGGVAGAVGGAIKDLLGVGGGPAGVAGSSSMDYVRAGKDREESAKRAEELSAKARASGQAGLEKYWTDIASSYRKYHSGGMISGGRDAIGALAARLSGAPAFAGGGIVNAASQALRSRFRGLLNDDVPAVLQQGEGVLSRRGVAAAGGPAAVENFNRGEQQAPQLGPLVIEGSSAGVRALLQAAIASWRVEAGTSGSGVRKTLDGGSPFFGIQMVRGRGV